MPTQQKDLGELVSTHTTSPAFLQRAAIVAVVSFVFFLAMLVAFYVRQNIGYFALSSAFLIVYIFTLIGWVIQRRSTVKIYENGLRYRKFTAAWNEIRSVKADGAGLNLFRGDGDKVSIPSSIEGYQSILKTVKQGIKKSD